MAGEFDRWMASEYSTASDVEVLRIFNVINGHGIAQTQRAAYAAINFHGPFETDNLAHDARLGRADAYSIVNHCVQHGFMDILPEEDFPPGVSSRFILHVATRRLTGFAAANNYLDMRLTQAHMSISEPDVTDHEIFRRSIVVACIGEGREPAMPDELPQLAAMAGKHEEAFLHGCIEAFATNRGIRLKKLKLRMLTSMPEEPHDT
jgi:hypothetical protein